MSRPETVQFNFKQWMGDDKVIGMDWDASGMHMWLLGISTQQNPPGSLPNDIALIRRWLRSPSDDVWRRVSPQVLSAWTLRGDRWFNAGMVATFERKEKYGVRPQNQNGTTAVPKPSHNHVTTTEVLKEPGLPDVELPDKPYEFDVQEATTYVFLEVGLAGKDARMMVQDAVKSFIKNNNCIPKIAAEQLVASWNAYERADIPFKRGKTKFFAEGLWRNPEGWHDSAKQPVSKKQQRTNSNQRLIMEEIIGAEAGPSSEGVELRTRAGGIKALAAGVGGVHGGGS